MKLTPLELVKKSPQLASAPSVYNKLRVLLNDDNSSAENISAVVNTDPALAVQLLKLVNSAYYGFPSQISTISRAITVIGSVELMNLVLVASVIDSFDDIPEDLLSINDFWRHSLGCAIAATYIAQLCKQDDIERFFIMGLLHNIGSLILLQTEPAIAKQAMMSANAGEEVIFKAEQHLLGFDHTDIGRELSDLWRLPPSIGEAIRYHHSPSLAVDFPIETAIVHLADIVVSSAQLGNSGTHHVPPLDSSAWDLLNLDESILPEAITQARIQLDNLTAAMI